MDNQQVFPAQPLTLETVVRRRSLVPTFFGLTILFFFFTFCEFRCQGRHLADVSGLDMAMGTQLDMPSPPTLFGEAPPPEQKDMPANIWAIIALLAAAAGLGIYLKGHELEAKIGAAAGGAGVLALFILKATVTAAAEKETQGMMAVDFKFGYWAALLALLAAGAISFLRFRQLQQDDTAEQPPTVVAYGEGFGQAG